MGSRYGSVFILIAVAACGGGSPGLPDAPPGHPDAAGQPDAPATPDATVPTPDAIVPPPDAMVPPPDAMILDSDGDGVLDTADNCPGVANPTQDDNDVDGIGDACDDDDDNDTVLDGADNCPLDANVGQDDADGDSAGDVCDDDDDNDSILDVVDNCVVVANVDQSDLDGDGAGDVCDADDDNDGVDDTSDNCPTVPNPTQDDGDLDGFGDACDGAITPVVSGVIVGGNIASTGAGFSGRWTGVAVSSVDLTISTVPPTAAIVRSYLYWTVIGTPWPTVTLAGQDVTGTLIGTTDDTCWGIGTNFMYRADVTALVAGNGTYTLANLLSSTSGPDGQGASLVVVYADAFDARTNYIGISDGAIGFVGTGVPGQATATGFTIGAGYDRVTGINIVADGQPASDALQIGSELFGGGDAFVGAQGGMWDNRVDDATTAVTPGDTSITTIVSSDNDCLAWSMSAIVIEDVDAASFAGSLPHPAITPVAPITPAHPALRVRPFRGKLVPIN